MIQHIVDVVVQFVPAKAIPLMSLPSSKEVFFDMIDYIEDPDYNRKYLIALKDIILDQQSDNHTIKPFNMKNVSINLKNKILKQHYKIFRKNSTYEKKKLKWARIRVKGPLENIPVYVDVEDGEWSYRSPVWCEALARYEKVRATKQQMCDISSHVNSKKDKSQISEMAEKNQRRGKEIVVENLADFEKERGFYTGYKECTCGKWQVAAILKIMGQGRQLAGILI